MKCGFCGKEIENGAEICPYCGMILNLQDDNSSEPEVNIPDYTPNIFGAGIEKEKENTVAAELPVNDAEESVPVVESIPEYAAQDFNPVEYDLSYQPPEYNPEAEISADESDAAQQEAAEEEAHTAAEQEQVYQDEANEAEADISTEASEEIEDIYSYSSPIEAEEVSENEAQSADVSEIRIPEEDVSYPEYEAFAPVEEAYEDVEDILSAEPEEEEYEEIPVVAVAQDGVSAEEPEDVSSDDDDTYVKSGKMKSGIAAVVALCILLVCLVFAGGYVIKNVFPEKAPSTTQKDETSTSAADETSEEDTTEAETDEEDTTEDTTEDITDEETTEADVTEDETTTSETQEVESTTAPSTTKETTTKKPVTTTQRPVTTTKRPVTTTRKPVTTTKAPSTTAPKATEGYGINNVPVKKPAKYLATKYKAYVTANSVRVRASATTDSSLVLHLQKGSEVVVYGSENGFLYVYSTRFGVYGWISKAYLSSSRPTTDSTTVPSGAVSPDKNGSGKIMYTTFTLNLRKGPGTNYGVVKTIPINYPVKVIGYKSGVSGWAYVTDTTTGVNGWVSTAYLK